MIRNLGELGIFLQKIITRVLANQDLVKLLYYTDKDPLSHPDLTKDQIKSEVFEKLVKFIPKVGPKETAQSLIVFRVSNCLQNSNLEFQDITINVEVFVPITQWVIKDSNLRPFAIMGEIEKSLNGKIIDGLGKMDCSHISLNFLSDEITCYEMTYNIVSYD